LYRRALATTEKTLGAEHPQTATILLNLAALYERTDRNEEAQRAFERASQIMERVFGDRHPLTATTLDNYACFLVAAGRPEEALIKMTRAADIWSEHRARLFAFATEREQLAFVGLPETRRGGMNISLTLAAELLPQNPAARRFALDVVLANKGLMLETLAARQADVLGSDDPKLRRLYTEWQTAGRALLREQLDAPKSWQTKGQPSRVPELEKRKEAAEQALARVSARFIGYRLNARVGVDSLELALPADAALVEFVRYRSFRFGARDGKEWGNYKYVALVMCGGGNREHDVMLVALGPAAPIEAAIQTWRKAVGPRPRGSVSPRVEVEKASAELARLVWKPVASSLAGCHSVYIAPDGELAFVSFGALPGNDTNKFLMEEFDISFVATGRDLVRRSEAKAGKPVLIGAPEFGAVLAQGGSEAFGPLRALSFHPLPSTKIEVETISRLLDAQKQGPMLITGTEATEARVKALRQPGLLHLATHGFFLPDTGISEFATDEKLRGVGGVRLQAAPELDISQAGRLWREIQLHNPMQRSGIALAGANETLRGQRALGDDDGILTAEEVTRMDLWGTRCVVVSACESGLGEAKGGEGVFGLRRAFTLAGAQSLVMALWSVSDDSTRELMGSLYRQLEAAGTAPRALLIAQRDWIARERAAGRYPHPFHWAAFIASGTGPSHESR
jgi:CHAT domain-containing protein